MLNAQPCLDAPSLGFIEPMAVPVIVPLALATAGGSDDRPPTREARGKVIRFPMDRVRAPRAPDGNGPAAA